jgi:type II secretory pathway component PulF
MTQLIAAGEMSGKLGPALTRIADIIDKDIDKQLKRMTALVEPILMIGMGGIVGSIAIAIMMPIYDISRSLQH